MNLLRKIADYPYAVLAAATVVVAAPNPAYAQQNAQAVGDVAKNVYGQVGNVGKLVVIGSLLVGVIMVAAGLMKLKQASDTQGQQVKYGDGLWRLVVGAGLVAIPAMSGMLAATFGFDAPAIQASSGF